MDPPSGIAADRPHIIAATRRLIMARPRKTGELSSERKEVYFTPSEMRAIAKRLDRHAAANGVSARMGTYLHDVVMGALAAPGAAEAPSTPVWGAIAAGDPGAPELEERGRISCSAHPSGPSYGYLEVQGESMNRQVPAGSLALFRRRQYTPGQIVAVRLAYEDHCDFTLKRLEIVDADGLPGSSIVLHPDSTDEAFKPIVLSPQRPRHGSKADKLMAGWSFVAPMYAFIEGVFTGDYIVRVKR